MSYKKRKEKNRLLLHSWLYFNHIEPIQAVYLACAVWLRKANHVTGEIWENDCVRRNFEEIAYDYFKTSSRHVLLMHRGNFFFWIKKWKKDGFRWVSKPVCSSTVLRGFSFFFRSFLLEKGLCSTLLVLLQESLGSFLNPMLYCPLLPFIFQKS